MAAITVCGGRKEERRKSRCRRALETNLRLEMPGPRFSQEPGSQAENALGRV